MIEVIQPVEAGHIIQAIIAHIAEINTAGLGITMIADITLELRLTADGALGCDLIINGPIMSPTEIIIGIAEETGTISRINISLGEAMMASAVSDSEEDRLLCYNFKWPMRY